MNNFSVPEQRCIDNEMRERLVIRGIRCSVQGGMTCWYGYMMDSGERENRCLKKAKQSIWNGVMNEEEMLSPMMKNNKRLQQVARCTDKDPSQPHKNRKMNVKSL